MVARGLLGVQEERVVVKSSHRVWQTEPSVPTCAHSPRSPRSPRRGQTLENASRGHVTQVDRAVMTETVNTRLIKRRAARKGGGETTHIPGGGERRDGSQIRGREASKGAPNPPKARLGCLE